MFIVETRAIIITELFLQLHPRSFRSSGVQVTRSSSEDACRVYRQYFQTSHSHNRLGAGAQVSFSNNLSIP